MRSYHKHHRSSRQLRRTATPRFFYFCCSLVLVFAGIFAFFWLRGSSADALANATPPASASATATVAPTAHSHAGAGSYAQTQRQPHSFRQSQGRRFFP